MLGISEILLFLIPLLGSVPPVGISLPNPATAARFQAVAGQLDRGGVVHAYVSVDDHRLRPTQRKDRGRHLALARLQGSHQGGRIRNSGQNCNEPDGQETKMIRVPCALRFSQPMNLNIFIPVLQNFYKL